MKLNLDCIRDVLIYLEDNLEINSFNQFSKIELRQIQNNFKYKYTSEDIYYSVYNLYKAKYIEGNIHESNDNPLFFCEVNNISWEGHDFLNNVRKQSIWDITKKCANKIGSMSLLSVGIIAKEIIQTIIHDQTFISFIAKEIINSNILT